MRLWQELLFIIKKLSRHRADRELDDEIRAHLEMETQMNCEAGLSPEEARHKAMRSFGSPALAKENSRSVWGLQWWETILQDV
ncbi:MAG: permease prefix domain 1-containing protein, partial [Blastocatellia bacterium]